MNISCEVPSSNILYRKRNLLMPGLLGNILEWYEFALYGYFSSKISYLFFPSDDQFLSLLAVFGVFAVGLFMRPLGGILFGYVGDRYGRKIALSTSILMMSIPTCIMGSLPTYNEIGIYAGVVLTLCRLLQGLAIGGEFTSSIVYIIEQAPPNARGFYGSWIMFSAFAGILLGSAVSGITDYMSSGTDAAEWVWRIPFISGIGLGVLGLYLRTTMPETNQFSEIKSIGKIVGKPLKTAVSSNYKKILCATGLVILPAVSFYLIFVYLVTYLNIYLDIPLSTALFINSFSMVVIISVIPFVGKLSDKFGRKPITLIGVHGIFAFSFILFWIMSTKNLYWILFAQCCFSILIAFVYASIPAILMEIFDVIEIRCTALSIPYNLSNALFGGTVPFISTFLIHYSGSIFAPSVYLMLLSIIMMILVVKIPETYKKMI